MSRLQAFLNTGPGLRFALWLGKIVPPGPASAALRVVASLTARRPGSRLVAAVKSNLGVVLDRSPEDPELTRLAAGAVYHSAMAGYEFFHKVGRGREALGELATIPDDLFAILEEAERQRQGVVAVSAHIGALDLLGVAITATDYQIQVISYARPPAGYQIVNELRAGEGLIMTPASKETMVEAKKRLEDGGIVFTALDRPVPPGRTASTVTFFGRATQLWDGYTSLALATGSLLFFLWLERTAQGRYLVRFNDPIDCSDPPGDTEAVTAMMLGQAERAIRAHPEQWLMFYPLWPDPAGGPAQSSDGAIEGEIR